MPGRRPLASFYSPKEYKDWQKEAARLLRGVKHPPEAPFDGPVEVLIIAKAQRPKTTKLPHPKPDVDNYAKAVLDVLTADGRFWSDDSQVSELIVRKEWAETPSIYVQIEKA